MPDDRLSDPNEMLFRQVNPSWICEGRPTSQAFRPTPKDNHKLSIALGSITTAIDAFLHHTETLHLDSAGTWGITVEECTDQDLPVRPDPIPGPDPPRDLAHGIVDFSGVPSRSQRDAKGIRLARRALERGKLAPPS